MMINNLYYCLVGISPTNLAAGGGHVLLQLKHLAHQLDGSAAPRVACNLHLVEERGDSDHTVYGSVEDRQIGVVGYEWSLLGWRGWHAFPQVLLTRVVAAV